MSVIKIIFNDKYVEQILNFKDKSAIVNFAFIETSYSSLDLNASIEASGSAKIKIEYRPSWEVVNQGELREIEAMLEEGLLILKNNLPSYFKIIPFCAMEYLNEKQYHYYIDPHKIDTLGNTGLHKLAKNISRRCDGQYLLVITELIDKMYLYTLDGDGLSVIDILRDKGFLSDEKQSELEAIELNKSLSDDQQISWGL